MADKIGKEKASTEKSIEILNNALITGYALWQKIKNKTPRLEKTEEDDFIGKPNFNQINSLIKQWQIDVVGSMKKNLSFYDTFHFLLPRVEWTVNDQYDEDSEETINENLDYLRNYLFAIEDIIVRLEERNALNVRKEIAEKEHQADVLYRITYSDHSREIKMNGVIIAKPDFDSENDRFFSFVYANPNRLLSREEIEKTTGKLKKSNSDILRDLGFNGAIRQIFFSGVSKTKTMFNNPITKQYAIKNDLPSININELKRNKEV